jgi:hypothetical protein
VPTVASPEPTPEPTVIIGRPPAYNPDPEARFARVRDRQPEAWPADCEREGRACYATPLDERGVRCVYVVNDACATVCHMEQQHCEAAVEVAALMDSALTLRTAAADAPAADDAPACATITNASAVVGAYRVYLTLDEVQPCSPAELAALFELPSFHVPTPAAPAPVDAAPAAPMAASGDTKPASALGADAASSKDTSKVTSGVEALDVDDDIAVPFDQFWAEFL